jgi:hypothetical protein
MVAASTGTVECAGGDGGDGGSDADAVDDEPLTDTSRVPFCETGRCARDVIFTGVRDGCLSPALPCAVFPFANRKDCTDKMSLRGAKWTAMMTRATQTLRACLHGPLIEAVAGSAGVPALACARACVSLVRTEWLDSQTVLLCQCERLSTPSFCLLGGAGA